MWFRPVFSRLRAVWDELLQVHGEFFDDGLEAADGGGIKQGGHHHMHPHQADRCRHRRAFVVSGIRRPRGRQGDHLLALTGQPELAHRLEAIGNIETNTEMDPARRQHRHQPATRKAPIQHQQIVCPQRIQGLEEHLPLVAQRFMHCKIEEQLNPWQVQAESHPVHHGAHAVLHHRQTHRAAIGGDHAQPLPARHRQVLIDKGHQLTIHIGEHQGADLVARTGKCLGRHDPDRVSTIPEVGEELVEFGLNGTLQAREQEGHDGLKAEGAFPVKYVGLSRVISNISFVNRQ